MKHLLFILTTSLYALIIYLLNNGWHSDSNVSLFYVLLAICSLLFCWFNSDRKLDLFLLYLLTFHLFIGGRFFVCLFDHSLTPFEPTFFYEYKVSTIRVVELMNYVYTFLYFVVLGHYFSRIYPLKNLIRFNSPYINQGSITSISQFFYPILVACLLYRGINAAIHSLQHGYAIVDYSVTDVEYNVSIVGKFAPMLLVLLLAMTFAYAKDSNKKYLMLYAVYGVIILVGGSRGAFGSILLLWLWIYSIEYKVSLLRIGLLTFGGLVILLLIFSLSARGYGLENFTLFDAIKIFLYDNGASLMVFDTSRLVDDYPILPYFQTFIPGVSYLYSFVSGATLYPQDISFEGHLCNTINSTLFSRGAGLGWTTLSDIYVYAKGHIILFSIFSAFIGSIIGCLEHWSKKSFFYKYIVIAIAPGVLMMSRGMLSALFVQIIYALLFYVLLHNYYKYKAVYSNKSIKESDDNILSL